MPTNPFMPPVPTAPKQVNSHGPGSGAPPTAPTVRGPIFPPGPPNLPRGFVDSGHGKGRLDIRKYPPVQPRGPITPPGPPLMPKPLPPTTPRGPITPPDPRNAPPRSVGGGDRNAPPRAVGGYDPGRGKLITPPGPPNLPRGFVDSGHGRGRLDIRRFPPVVGGGINPPGPPNLPRGPVNPPGPGNLPPRAVGGVDPLFESLMQRFRF